MEESSYGSPKEIDQVLDLLESDLSSKHRNFGFDILRIGISRLVANVLKKEDEEKEYKQPVWKEMEEREMATYVFHNDEILQKMRAARRKFDVFSNLKFLSRKGVIDRKKEKQWRGRIKVLLQRQVLLEAQREVSALATIHGIDPQARQLDRAREAIQAARETTVYQAELTEIETELEYQSAGYHQANIEKYLNFLKNGQYFIYSRSPVKDIEGMIYAAQKAGLDDEVLDEFEDDISRLKPLIEAALKERLKEKQ